ncbi:MAG TPA: glycosyltransferase [Phycisphaerales bacterium]|nr:glycosyltransferase [Phycisphaerales bacterium]
MRILMLGWEFPPFISGGLGTACYGLTRALDRLGHDVVFVLPKSVDQETASHVTLVSPSAGSTLSLGSAGGNGRSVRAGVAGIGAGGAVAALGAHYTVPGFSSHVQFMGVPATRRSPYPGGESGVVGMTNDGRRIYRVKAGAGRPAGTVALNPRSPAGALAAAGVEDWEEWIEFDESGAEITPQKPAASSDYGGDIVGDSQRYAKMVLALCRYESFDVIHAHDWMTYPAGIAMAQLSGRPLVVHVHSTEFDRSGEHVNQRVYDIERRGMHAAIRVITVSGYTKSICVQRYAVDPAKIDVVYNGIETEDQKPGVEEISSKDKIVLFLGRITMQKGPEYFVAAAQRVLQKLDNVKFLIAGSGDMERRVIELAAQMGIGHKVLFTGFLRGRDVARVYSMADCYVMPSVSEPFGIAPLEAISHDVPVIISKQSGVSEVLTHALKVDFWDVDEMANKIVAVLKYPPLSQTLREHGHIELRKLTWEGAAEGCVDVYEKAASAVEDLVGIGV